MTLSLNQLQFAYGTTPILREITLSLAAGQIGCLLGTSGCGKSTLLRCIAGFERFQAGQIELAGQICARAGYPNLPNLHIAPHLRGVGMVFQDYALFPHLTVAQNIAFGLHRWSRVARDERVMALLTRIGLTAQAQQYPHQLSGGQQQRVALARALAPRPQLLLLDEPLSSLDAQLRHQLAFEVREMIRAEGMTALWVTHDQDEAMHVADIMGVMHEGRLLQWDSPYTVYHQPNSRTVAQFIGQSALIRAQYVADNQLELSGFGRYPIHAMTTAPSSATHAASMAWDVLLRPDDVVHEDGLPTQAVVVNKQFNGANFIYQLQLADGQILLAEVPSHHNHDLGESIGIRLDLTHVVAFESPPSHAS